MRGWWLVLDPECGVFSRAEFDERMPFQFILPVFGNTLLLNE